MTFTVLLKVSVILNYGSIDPVVGGPLGDEQLVIALKPGVQKKRGFGWDQRTSCCKSRTLDSLSYFSSPARTTAASIILYSASICNSFGNLPTLKLSLNCYGTTANSFVTLSSNVNRSIQLDKQRIQVSHSM
jgi:hypothetical protein